MKKYVVTASILAGLSMISGTAFAQTSGHVGVNAGRADFGGGEADGYGVDGAVTLQTGGSWNVLLDASFDDSDDADSTISGTAHLINRGDTNAWGGYVGLVDTDGGNGYVAGGEYAQFFGASTLAVGLGYGSIDDVDVDLYGINGEYRIFASDNLRFDLGAGLIRAESGGNDADGVSYGAGVEYRFAQSPISIGASYTFIDIDDAGIDGDVIGLTLRWNFGDASLKERDRKGNTFGELGGFGSALGSF